MEEYSKMMYSTSFTKEVFRFLCDNGILNLAGADVKIYTSDKTVTILKEGDGIQTDASSIESPTVLPKAFLPVNQVKKLIETGLIDKEVLGSLFTTSKPFPSKSDKNLMMVSIEPKDSVQDLDSILGIKAKTEKPAEKAVAESHNDFENDFTDEDITI